MVTHLSIALSSSPAHTMASGFYLFVLCLVLGNIFPVKSGAGVPVLILCLCGIPFLTLPSCLSDFTPQTDDARPTISRSGVGSLVNQPLKDQHAAVGLLTASARAPRPAQADLASSLTAVRGGVDGSRADKNVISWRGQLNTVTSFRRHRTQGLISVLSPRTASLRSHHQNGTAGAGNCGSETFRDVNNTAYNGTQGGEVNRSTNHGTVVVTAQEMRRCHRSQSRILVTALAGNVTVTGDGEEFMDVTGDLVCDVIVVVPEKHVLFVHLVRWEYECEYYFSDLFLVFDSSTGPMNSLLPHQLCVTQGSQVYSSTNNVTLRFVWEPTGRAFRFVVTFRAISRSGSGSGSRTYTTFTPAGNMSHTARITKGTQTPRRRQPHRMTNGQWNCTSTPLSSLRQTPLYCNLRVECAGAEDEAACSYTSPRCGLGGLDVAGSCFLWVSSEINRTWEEAGEECGRRGGHLAVLNSRGEWLELRRLLDRARHPKEYNLMALGIRVATTSVPPRYRQLYQWVDGTIAYDIATTGQTGQHQCGFIFLAGGFYYRDFHFVLMFRSCPTQITDYFLCEIPPQKSSETGARVELSEGSSAITMPSPAANRTVKIPSVTCPMGHLTHEHLACDVSALCFTSSSPQDRRAASCSAPLTPLPPMFTCSNELERVPYSSVCDHRVDCVDESDEGFCTFSPCDPLTEEQCGDRECKPRDLWCDFNADCASEADERQCQNYEDIRMSIPTPRPPAVVNFNMEHKSLKAVTVVFSPLQTKGPDGVLGNVCPETHFQCPANGYCLPVFLRCNQVLDCPGGQDEERCTDHTCPGLFRCHSSQVCVHAQFHVCDGQAHCPRRDDESVCDSHCPRGCVCYWNSFICSKPSQVGMYSDLKYLDASGTGMNLVDVSSNAMLIYLKLDSCRLTSLQSPLLPNLQSLVVSHNNLTGLQVWHLTNLSSVRHLDLSGNPLAPTFLSDLQWPAPFTNLKALNFSGVDIPQLSSDDFSLFPDAEELHLTSCGIERILHEGFQALKKLRVLKLQGSVIQEFPPTMLQGLDALHSVEADSYKVCCPVVLPEGYHEANCLAPHDEVSSCGNLLRYDSYTVLLGVFAALSLVCNSGSFLYRVWVEKAKDAQGFAVFVTHLCAADLLMGVYLAVVGVADRKYRGSYLWNDESWKTSLLCKLAGVLSLLSSEVSAFLICLITVDRFLVLQFPFSEVRFRRLSGHAACGLVWVCGLALAGLPLLPVFRHWKFYGQTGICLPLPITRHDHPGQDYSFGVMIVLNFVLFILIVVGQAIIFWSIRKGSMSAVDTSKESKDLAIARRLISIAMSDFLCWFPVGILGLMASQGRVISGEVNVAIAIIVLPINSVLNPFLYTLNIIMEIRQRARLQRKQKAILLKLELEGSPDTRQSAGRRGRGERSDSAGHDDSLVWGGDHAPLRENVRTQAEENARTEACRETAAVSADVFERAAQHGAMKHGCTRSTDSGTTFSEAKAWLLLTAWLNSGILTQQDLLEAVTGSDRATIT